MRPVCDPSLNAVCAEGDPLNRLPRLLVFRRIGGRTSAHRDAGFSAAPSTSSVFSMEPASNSATVSSRGSATRPGLSLDPRRTPV